MNLNNTEINYLGALLHDVGKLIWRSKPIKAGDDHEKLGEQFIRENLGRVECLKTDIEEVIKAANRQRGKIWLADIKSAKERQDSDDKLPRRYLEAITNRVNLGESNKKNKADNYWYKLPKVLSLEKSDNFPQDSGVPLNNYSHQEDEYLKYHKSLLDELKGEIRYLENETNFKTFASTFYHLLEKYTSKVLSAGYHSHPDISLFDHSRITAALSVCLEEGDEGKECLLIKGDISGIQSYIYGGIRDMTGIAKRLRGRSFTIQMLTDAISILLLEQLNLFDANLIYNGGGHFLILAPNNKSKKDLLTKLEIKVNESLLYEYTGRLALVLEKLECNSQEFIQNFKAVYKNLDNNLNNKKKIKNKNILPELFNNPLKANEFKEKEEEIEELEINVGAILPKIEYIVIINNRIDIPKDNNFEIIPFNIIGYFVYLCRDIKSVEKILASTNDTTRVISVNQLNFLNHHDRLVFRNNIRSFRLLGNNIPRDENGQPLSFEELAQIYSKNYPLLGIMRMDVDNLGAIFSFGLTEQNEFEKKYTPSRVANLSRELNWFFTGYINKLAEEYNIYIAYSGGDDLFVVGNWYKLIKFANQLKKDFDTFVCENQNLTASAGIIFTKPNFPISQSALLAGEQEKLAKDTIPRLEKNKIGVLDIQLTWEELDEFIKYADELIEFLDTEEGKKIIPRSFLYNLYSLTNNIFDSKGKANLRKLSKSKSTLHYMFARKKVNATIIEQNNKGKQRVNDLLYKLAVKLLLSEDKEKELKKIKFPLTLALYKTRR